MVILDTKEKFRNYLSKKYEDRNPVIIKGVIFDKIEDFDLLWRFEYPPGSIFLNCYFIESKTWYDYRSKTTFLMDNGGTLSFINCEMHNTYPEIYTNSSENFGVRIVNLFSNSSILFSSEMNKLYLEGSNVDRITFNSVKDSNIVINRSNIKYILFEDLSVTLSNDLLTVSSSHIGKIKMSKGDFARVNKESPTVKALFEETSLVTTDYMDFEDSIMDGIDISNLRIKYSVLFEKCNVGGLVIPKEFIDENFKDNPYKSVLFVNCNNTDNVSLPDNVSMIEQEYGSRLVYRLEVNRW